MAMSFERRSLHTLIPSVVLAVLATAGPAGADAPAEDRTSDGLEVHVLIEVESRVQHEGRASTKLIPADRAVPGDRVLYTLEVRNVGPATRKSPIIVHPVPEHMRYLDDTAVGPGAEVTYSVDGGHSFDRATNLRVPLPAGNSRHAVGADYTHIRWQLRNPLEVNSVAFVRFRAVVK